MNITEAAQAVLKDSTSPMSPADIHAEIAKRDLFTFGAKNPVSIVSSTLRKKSDADPKATKVIFKKSGKGEAKVKAYPGCNAPSHQGKCFTNQASEKADDK